MIKALDALDFLEQSAAYLTVDVRSEGEFAYGHIPHAISLPLFNNAERASIGTTYKQTSSQEAILQGLDIVGPKMSGFIRFVQPLVKDNKIFVHCWRGGMRSGSMAWLFNQFGYEVYTMRGGYKAYRRLVLDTLAAPYKYIVLGGRTGTGKTDTLKVLEKAGEQVIDLEGLARHKGSAFGMLGQLPQPSTEHFENLLHQRLKQFDTARRVWLEDESKKIGTVVLDNYLWNRLKQAPLLVMELPLEVRLKRLVADYSLHPAVLLEQSVTALRKRLGGNEWKSAIDALHTGDFTEVARILLHYYDKTYDYNLSQRESKQVTHLVFEEDDLMAIAEVLISAAKQGL